MTSITYRAGAMEIEAERLSPALLNRANVALTKGIWLGTTRPTQEQLRALCSDCDAYGLRDGSACKHRMAVLAWFAQAEGLPVRVRKAGEQAVA